MRHEPTADIDFIGEALSHNAVIAVDVFLIAVNFFAGEEALEGLG